MMLRRSFLMSAPAWGLPFERRVMTVRGPVKPSALGLVLVHEHLFSIFGADPREAAAYDEPRLMEAVVPYVRKLKALGCGSIADGTAAWFGRSPTLLRKISEATGVHILTNTGYYGAASDRYVPQHAHAETADRLAERWTKEWQEGIAGTGIRPGFMKLGVDAGALSAIDRKLVTAAARTHLKTGLPIQAHTGDNAQGALEQIGILKAEGVHASAWIWIHANNCNQPEALREAAEKGAWISFDGVAPETVDRHLELIAAMKKWGRLSQALLSHDGNSFRAGGRPMKPYDGLFTHFLPALAKTGFTEKEKRLLTEKNPQQALAIRVRRG